MLNLKYFILIGGLILTLIMSCRGYGSKVGNVFQVTEIVSGNKIKVANGKVYGLIGLNNKDANKELLREILLNETISYNTIAVIIHLNKKCMSM